MFEKKNNTPGEDNMESIVLGRKPRFQRDEAEEISEERSRPVASFVCRAHCENTGARAERRWVQAKADFQSFEGHGVQQGLTVFKPWSLSTSDATWRGCVCKDVWT